MRSTSAVYVSSVAAYDKHKERLKQTACPKCRAVGCLIRHGYLRGYGEAADERIQRGWRVFCSNRGRRRGCGGTYAILLAHHLYRRLVGTGRLWRFLAGVLSGSSIQHAWETVAAPFALETGYKLWASFIRNQSAIRVRLHAVAGCAKSDMSPLLQTIAHLKAAFPCAACPVASFQNSFQRAFLTR